MISNSHDWFRKGWARLAPSGYGIKDDSGTIGTSEGGKLERKSAPERMRRIGIIDDAPM